MTSDDKDFYSQSASERINRRLDYLISRGFDEELVIARAMEQWELFNVAFDSPGADPIMESFSLSSEDKLDLVRGLHFATTRAQKV
ncbi:hypothetical protein [Candidatus Thiosymbion oneisti]|uniref:hypothetical protein n=1 Tax=Candidatus Thiosymbion oneisti TaxID=589554 RepID=UPI001060A560|nr:hypothetical protein [Candidatus Thiosymbion oneisti]